MGIFLVMTYYSISDTTGEVRMVPLQRVGKGRGESSSARLQRPFLHKGSFLMPNQSTGPFAAIMSAPRGIDSPGLQTGVFPGSLTWEILPGIVPTCSLPLRQNVGLSQVLDIQVCVA